MANPEHLAIVRQGVKVWNRWAEKRGELLEIDLNGLDLSYTDLSRYKLSLADLTNSCLKGSYLFGTNLAGAELAEADLREAHLDHANLIGANLSGANLSDTDLRRTDLSRANLTGAALSRANIRGTNLSEAILSGANLNRAFVGWTIFTDIDLSEVKGLETVEHTGPSSIGLNTIYRSKGRIPEIFLRNTGVPESFITNMRSLIGAMSPIDFYSCFISYSRGNDDFAHHLHADLQSKGVRCWFAPENLKIGDKFWHRIDESIRLYDKLLVVLSEHSVQSDWVEREVMAALEKEKQGKTVLFPITLDDAVKDCTAPWAADIRRSRHIGDFEQWKDHDAYQVAFERLLRDLKAQS